MKSHFEPRLQTIRCVPRFINMLRRTAILYARNPRTMLIMGCVTLCRYLTTALYSTPGELFRSYKAKDLRSFVVKTITPRYHRYSYETLCAYARKCSI